MCVGVMYYWEGIFKGVMLVVDVLLNLCDGLLFVCVVDGEFKFKWYRIYFEFYFENLENGKCERLCKVGEILDDDKLIFGVIMYIINDVCFGEFDDCLVMWCFVLSWLYILLCYVVNM